MKNQAYYDKLIVKPQKVGDEMGALEFCAWVLTIGSLLGWIVATWLTN